MNPDGQTKSVITSPVFCQTNVAIKIKTKIQFTFLSQFYLVMTYWGWFPCQRQDSAQSGFPWVIAGVKLLQVNCKLFHTFLFFMIVYEKCFSLALTAKNSIDEKLTSFYLI